MFDDLSEGVLQALDGARTQREWQRGVARRIDEAPERTLEQLPRHHGIPHPTFEPGEVVTRDRVEGRGDRHRGSVAGFRERQDALRLLDGEQVQRARLEIVTAVTCWEDPKRLAEISTGLGAPMRSIETTTLTDRERFAERGS